MLKHCTQCGEPQTPDARFCPTCGTQVGAGDIDPLLGMRSPGVRSAYLIPFADPAGGWMHHVRMKVFPPLKTTMGTIKYLQPRGSGVRLYFPASYASWSHCA